jgi:putative oxidoreductase
MVDKQDLGILIIRLTLGITLALHGAQKVFGILGGTGLDGWNKWITSLDIPYTNVKFPIWISTSAAWIEFLTGIFIILGVSVKLTSIIAIIFLLFAVKLVHYKKGYFISDGGYEYALNLILLSIFLILSGSGKYSVLPNSWDL